MEHHGDGRFVKDLQTIGFDSISTAELKCKMEIYLRAEGGKFEKVRQLMIDGNGVVYGVQAVISK